MGVYHADLSEYPNLVADRNKFVLAYLTGMQFSDFSSLEPSDLRNDLLYKKQQKSNHTVVIPLSKEAKEIFTEEFKSEMEAMNNVSFNENIKEIARLARLYQAIKFSHKKGRKVIEVKKPKYAWVTFHTATRSFCTKEFLAGTPVKLIMLISGHKNEKDFYKYIRISPEEAANRIKLLWMERDKMQVFTDPVKKAINMKIA